MRWATTLRLRLRSLFRRRRVEDELGEELQYHLQHLVDDFVAGGMSPEDARHAARREMGAIEQRKEECRDARGMALVDSVRQDLTYALRTLRRSPGFAAVAILSLALGIGANAAIFTLWHALLRAPVPGVDKPGELVMLTDPDQSGSWTGSLDGPRPWLTYSEFEDLRDHADLFSGVMASQSSLGDWRVRVDGGEWEDARGRLVSGGFFQVLGVGAALGRVFTTAQDRDDSPYAVVSHNYWQRRFGGRSDVVGKTLVMRNASLTVIGVAPRGFIGETIGQLPDFWIPLRMQPSVMSGPDRLHDSPPEKRMWLHVFGRLKPNVTLAQAEGQANAIFRAGLESFYGPALLADRTSNLFDQRLQIQPAARGASRSRGAFSQPLTALFAAVGVVLLMACANLANLLLARGAARKPEIALRLSLGASRRRIVRQLVTESLALAALGGLASLVVAALLHGGLVRMLATADARFKISFGLDPLVLAFVLATTVAAVLVFGLLPAWQVTKADAGVTLKAQSRGVDTPGQVRSRRLLVCLQLALSLPLLVGAGLLERTVYNLQHADLGFPIERLLLVRVDLREGVSDEMRRDGVLRELAGEIQRVPGVQAVSFSKLGVFSGGESLSTIDVEGFVPASAADSNSAVEVVGPGYHSTLNVPLTRGREIDERDLGDGPPVCVINEAFARQFFDQRNPIGQHITAREDDGTRKQCEIVGVAKNARIQSLRGDVEWRFYAPARQPATPANTPYFLIRTTSESAAVMTAVRNTIQRVDAAIPIIDAATMDEQMAPLVAQDRTTAQVVVVFGGVALTLAVIGVYGVLSYGVARRAGEIAIRIALGAERSRVISMILGDAVGLVLVGLALGGGLAYAASRVISSRLYGVPPYDPLTLVLATGVLLVAALTAAYLPARRASRMNPLAALRQ